MSTKTVSREEEDIENCILFITTAPRMSSIIRSITSRPTLTRTVFRDSTEEVATLKTAEIADTLATSLATPPSPEVNSDLEELETLAELAKLCLEARDVLREDQEEVSETLALTEMLISDREATTFREDMVDKEPKFLSMSREKFQPSRVTTPV